MIPLIETKQIKTIALESFNVAMDGQIMSFRGTVVFTDNSTCYLDKSVTIDNSPLYDIYKATIHAMIVELLAKK
jgi:hypothetical protein